MAATLNGTTEHGCGSRLNVGSRWIFVVMNIRQVLSNLSGSSKSVGEYWKSVDLCCCDQHPPSCFVNLLRFPEVLAELAQGPSCWCNCIFNWEDLFEVSKRRKFLLCRRRICEGIFGIFNYAVSHNSPRNCTTVLYAHCHLVPDKLESWGALKLARSEFSCQYFYRVLFFTSKVTTPTVWTSTRCKLFRGLGAMETWHTVPKPNADNKRGWVNV